MFFWNKGLREVLSLIPIVWQEFSFFNFSSRLYSLGFVGRLVWLRSDNSLWRDFINLKYLIRENWEVLIFDSERNNAWRIQRIADSPEDWMEFEVFRDFNRLDKKPKHVYSESKLRKIIAAKVFFLETEIQWRLLKAYRNN